MRTCIQLKECRAQLTKLDREMTDRIGELTAETQDLREQLETRVESKQAERTNEAKLKSELAQSGAVVEQVRERYRAKVENLEAYYGKKISWLVSRVNLLEEGAAAGEEPQGGDYGSEYDDPRQEAPPRRGRSRTRRPLTGESDRMLEPESDAYYGDENLRRRGNSLQRRRMAGGGGGGGGGVRGSKMRGKGVRGGAGGGGARSRAAASLRQSQPAAARGRRKKAGVFRQRGRSKEAAVRNRSKSRSKSRSVTRTSTRVTDRFGGGGLSHSRSSGFGNSSSRKKKLAQQSLRNKYGAGGSGAKAVRSLQKMQFRQKGRRAW